MCRQSEKKLSPPHVPQYGELAAEIGPVVWGTPANFNGFRVLAALYPVYTIQAVVKPVV